jgi:catechol 2,3-dioxygenase-like lactoylglutathione lyase family enzyme
MWAAMSDTQSVPVDATKTGHLAKTLREKVLARYTGAMRIGHTELFVRNPQESKTFYVDVLGFELVSEQADGRLVWVRCGEHEILLRPGIPPEAPEIYRLTRAAVVLYSDNLDADVAQLKARGLAFEGDDGPGCPTFRDPDGNWFQLTNPGT